MPLQQSSCPEQDDCTVEQQTFAGEPHITGVAVGVAPQHSAPEEQAVPRGRQHMPFSQVPLPQHCPSF
jgi:hypothetical protein